MLLDQLPGHVLVQILQCLPFKDRVRVARVNRRLKFISEVAISRTTTFHLTAPIFRRIPMESMAKLIGLCSGSLQKVSFNNFDWGQSKYILQGRVFLLLQFTLPRLSTLNLVTFGNTLKDLLRQLLIKNPSVRTLEWNSPSTDFTDPNLVEPLQRACMNLERVEFHNLGWAGKELLPFFVNNCPNLKHLDLRSIVADDAPLRRLDSLKTLILGRYDSHVPDENLRQISILIPQLERLELQVNSDGITNRGLEYLENLRNLRDFKIVYWCQSNFDADAIGVDLTRCKRLNIVEFRGCVHRLNPSTVKAFTRHSPHLRQLTVQDIRDIDSPNSASRFVLSLDGFVQQNLSILINGGRSKVWKCPKVKSALAKINKSGKQLSIEIYSFDDNKAENEWGEFGDSSPIRKRWYRKVISWIRRLFRKR